MRAGIVVSVMPRDRFRLEAIVAHCKTRQKHAARARVIVATADGRGTTEVLRRSGLSKPLVLRWQERFMLAGVDGLHRDKTPKPGKPPLPAATVQRLFDLTLTEPPDETTHWSVRAMAKAAGIGAVSEQRIWQANGLDRRAAREELDPVPPAAVGRILLQRAALSSATSCRSPGAQRRLEPGSHRCSNFPRKFNTLKLIARGRLVEHLFLGAG
ncbi:helix-turn-helix domain-containing protein [Falsiroseomonas sp. E2-1-a4]|uniref:helix-turn-helix domain-containing protein n=1 Tax=Falsiroseomonas sp. E2-1-a4 TaxID=3239299 RepID=UPI003F2CC5CB